MNEAAWRLIGTPRFGGILIVGDHASNRVPDGVDLGINAALLNEHIGVDIGVREVAEFMAQNAGTAAFLANISRLVCDLNRDEDAESIIPECSDTHIIKGNAGGVKAHPERIAQYFKPYHTALAAQLNACPPALILSLHSFTPVLASSDQARPWHVGVLYNEDDRAARLAIPLLKAEGLIVGDQEPYSGKDLNATMNNHAEAEGRPYLGVEIRQDQIGDAVGQAEWADRMMRICNKVAIALGE